MKKILLVFALFGASTLLAMEEEMTRLATEVSQLEKETRQLKQEGGVVAGSAKDAELQRKIKDFAHRLRNLRSFDRCKHLVAPAKLATFERLILAGEFSAFDLRRIAVDPQHAEELIECEFHTQQ